MWDDTSLENLMCSAVNVFLSSILCTSRLSRFVFKFLFLKMFYLIYCSRELYFMSYHNIIACCCLFFFSQWSVMILRLISQIYGSAEFFSALIDIIIHVHRSLPTGIYCLNILELFISYLIVVLVILVRSFCYFFIEWLILWR